MFIEQKERYSGCLLGGAVGDALGAPIEFLSRSDILAEHGPAGLIDFVPAYGRVGAITDDTQMTLFTAEGLLLAAKDDLNRAGLKKSVHAAYQRWLYTQDQATPPLAGHQLDQGRLIRRPGLYSQRGPGNACLTSLMSGQTQPRSKGCGTVMRVAPVGLFCAGRRSFREAFELGMDSGSLTHGHPTAQLAAGALAVMIMALANGEDMLDALDRAALELAGQADRAETAASLELARALAANKSVRPEQAITRLGQGWVAEEALAIGLYCALVAPDLRQGLIMAVNHDGDSDSTGSIAGQLLGARLGQAAIPTEWLARLELRDVIEEMANDLFGAASER